MPATSKPVQPGDVYTFQLPDQRYGAVRVIQRKDKSSLVCTSEYLGTTPPKLDDPALKKILIQTRFFYKKEPDVTWYIGKPPEKFVYLGQVPPTPAESQRECNCHGGSWHVNVGLGVFQEWRWIHDRPAFEEEIRKEQEERARQRAIPKEPGKMMALDNFWAIIDKLDWDKTGDDDAVLAPAVKALSKMSVSDINQFAERFAWVLYQLDTREHARHIGDAYDPKEGFVSADGFLYARCAVVANGQKYYERVLKDPTQMPENLDFESLLSLVHDAYEMKTDEEWDYSTGCSFESFSNPQGWK